MSETSDNDKLSQRGRRHKLKIDTKDTSVTVFPADQGECIKPLIVISVKPKQHEKQPDQHYFEKPIKAATGGSFGLSEEQVHEINNHFAWLKSEYFLQIKQ